MKSFNKKKIIIIIIAIVLVLIGIIFIVINKSKTNLGFSGKKYQIDSVMDGKIFFPNIFSTDNSLIFLGDEGNIFYKLDLVNKNSEKLFDKEVLGPIAVSYNHAGSAAIVNSDYPELYNKYYNFSSKSEDNLSDKIISPIWQKDDKKIFYLYANGSVIDLDIADPNGKNWQKLLDLNLVLNGSSFLKNFSNGVLVIGQNGISNVDTITKKENAIVKDQAITQVQTDFESIIAYNSEGSNISKIIDTKNYKTYELKEKNNLDNSIFFDNENMIYANDIGSLEIINFKNGKITKINLNNNTDIEKYALQFLFKNLMLTTDKKTLYFTAGDFLYKIGL